MSANKFLIKIKLNPETLIAQVAVDDFTYQVEVDKEYASWVDFDPKKTEAMIKWSFDFLLQKESPKAILAKFKLSEINSYFPNYYSLIREVFC